MKALLAEAAGTALLVLLGCGAILLDARTHALGAAGVAAAFAVAVGLPVLLFGARSGAFLNPAITLALAASGRFPARRVPGYVAAQAAGATAAALLLLALGGPVGATHVAGPLAPWHGFVIEAAASALLALAVVRGVDARLAPGLAALPVGLAVGVDAMWAGPLTGASMNPARSLGPAVVSGAVADLWLYLAAPVLGCVLTVLVHDALRARWPRREEAGA